MDEGFIYETMPRNEKGDVVVPLIYDDATDFENGQARVQRYGQWTVIGTSGKPVK